MLRNKFAQLTPNNANEFLKKAAISVQKYLRQSNSKKTINNYQNLLVKDLKDQLIGLNVSWQVVLNVMQLERKKT